MRTCPPPSACRRSPRASENARNTSEQWTLDELFEALTLVATGKITRFPIVVVGSAYWAGLLSWMEETLFGGGDIGADELALLRVADDAEEVVRIIKEARTDLSVR